jgi:hypothetical protein
MDDHHQWITAAGNTLLVPGAHLWQAMCSVWAADCLSSDEAKSVVQPIARPIAKSRVTIVSTVFERLVWQFPHVALRL